MSDPSNIYHTSAVPPIMYYCGNEIIGGAVDTTIGDDTGFMFQPTELGTSQTNMIFTELGTLTEYTGGDMS